MSNESTPVSALQTAPIAKAPIAKALGRPKDEAKRAAILEAAARLFIENGFERTSMDAIARAAGVSKATLYSHFAGKDAIMIAGLHAKCERMIGAPVPAGSTPHEIRAALTTLATDFWNEITDETGAGIHRLVMMEGERHPALAKMFYEHAIMFTCDRLEHWFLAQHEAGNLCVPNAKRIAHLFLSAVKGLNLMRLQIHIPVTPEDVRVEIASAVDMIMVLCAPHST
jgi:TetR/AcrR family transcriptional regulator, mexJK operon transcriptional repressor